jgi:hypothetical protein
MVLSVEYYLALLGFCFQKPSNTKWFHHFIKPFQHYAKIFRLETLAFWFGFIFVIETFSKQEDPGNLYAPFPSDVFIYTEKLAGIVK